jgi:hypothetical protein
VSDCPEVLTGGNTSTSVLRIGDVVERDAGPWTASVHRVLSYLADRGVAAPRPIGHTATRERLTFVPGSVVHPDHWDLLVSDEDLAEVFRCIARLHEALRDFPIPSNASWHTVGADPRGPAELLCHNDLGPWNLVRTAEGWVFIDWDLLAPGRRDWELAWALMTMIPINPEYGLSATDIGRRLGVALRAYGVPEAQWPSVVDVLLERVEHAESAIRDGAARGEDMWIRLLATGHADVWHNAKMHARAHHARWLAVALQP